MRIITYLNNSTNLRIHYNDIYNISDQQKSSKEHSYICRYLCLVYLMVYRVLVCIAYYQIKYNY